MEGARRAAGGLFVGSWLLAVVVEGGGEWESVTRRVLGWGMGGGGESGRMGAAWI